MNSRLSMRLLVVGELGANMRELLCRTEDTDGGTDCRENCVSQPELRTKGRFRLSGVNNKKNRVVRGDWVAMGKAVPV